MEFRLSSNKFIKRLTMAIVLLILFHIIAQVLRYYFGRTYGFYLFDLDQEANIPTFYASVMLLFCSALLSIISIAKKSVNTSDWIYWAGLATIFLFLSLDEMIAIHEKLGRFVRVLLDTSGYLYFAWVIPYSILLVVFLLAYLKFLINLPQKTRLLFFIAGVIYVSGALGLEILGASEVVNHGYESINYIVLASLEESLEMIGVTTFIYALLLYLNDDLKWIRLNIVV